MKSIIEPIEQQGRMQEISEMLNKFIQEGYSPAPNSIHNFEMLKKLIEGYAPALNPVDNFEMLKMFRQNKYEIEKVKFIEERNSKKLKTGEFEMNCFYVLWLNNELKVIESWLSDKYPNGEVKKIRHSTSDQVEILKYESFIKSEKENIQKTEQFDKLPKTFLTGYTLPQLNTIRERMINAKLISDISKNNFVYLFTEQSITKKMIRIEWKESKPLSHEFLSRVVYHDKQFNFKQVNECIIYPKGKKLDSHDKSTAQYKNKDILNPILNV